MTKEKVILIVIVDATKKFIKKNVIDIWSVNYRLYKKGQKHNREMQAEKGHRKDYIDRLIFKHKHFKNKDVEIDNQGFNDYIVDAKFKSKQSIDNAKHGTPKLRKALQKIVNAKSEDNK